MLAVYPGTFDPFTVGHLDVLRRASRLFGRIVVAVCSSPSKHTLFTLDERVLMIEECLRGSPGIEVRGYSGLLVDLLADLDAGFLIRGIRNARDCEYELELTGMYRDFLPALEIVMLPADIRYAHISATLVREIYRHGGDISRYVPEEIRESVRRTRDRARRP